MDLKEAKSHLSPRPRCLRTNNNSHLAVEWAMKAQEYGLALIAEVTELRREVERARGRAGVWCQFCGEGYFDLYGLQLHLQNDWCPVYGILTKEEG